MAGAPLYILLCSGEHEKLLMAAMMASVGAVSERPVEVFVSMNALLAFARDASEAERGHRPDRRAGFTFFEQMVNTVGNEAMGGLADNTRLALEEAAEESTRSTPRGGFFAMLSLLARPEAQRSLGFLLSFSEKLQRRAARPRVG